MRPILVFIATQLLLTQSIGQNCVYTDSATGNKLYLDALEHATLTYTADEYNDKHTYTYTPCRNAAGECPNSSGSGGLNTAMCRQTLQNDPSICIVVADMDSSIEPSYDPDTNNGTWEFQFQNGDDDGCGVPRAFNVFFECDKSAGDYFVVTAGALGPACTYLFVIKTKWACPSENYTTTNIPMDCKWSANGGENILDLSTFDNDTIVAQMDSNEKYSYLYSPCRNELNCNNTMNMIQINNVFSLSCEQYLAIWETTQHTVNYDSVNKRWQFVYTNGEKCNGFQSITTIIWTCDKGIDSYKVVKADTIAPCQNVLEIKSKNACT